MRRRAFISAIGSVATASAVAQQPSATAFRIGYLDGSGTPHWFDAFRQGLKDLGYVENQTIVVERRSASGQSGQLPSLAAELVHLQPRVIVASGSRPTLAAKKATTTIPIVMAFATDPVGTGLVASLAHPGGNVTGLTNIGSDLMAKRLQLLTEVVPVLKRVGVIWAPSVDREFELDYRELHKASGALGLPLETFVVAQATDYDSAFEKASARVEGVAVLSGSLAFANREVIVAAAARHKVPAIYYDGEYAASGGLVSYGPSIVDLHRRAAVFVDKILKGANPADLPVEQPTKFELVVNLRTASSIGLNLSPALLARAEVVIE